MINNILQSAKSYVQRLEPVERAVLLGLGGVSAFFGGIPGMLTALGAYLFGKRVIDALPALPAPVSPSRLDPSTRLLDPKGPPPRIMWDSNSCFLSATMWGLFLNEPLLLTELTASIGRRLVEGELFNIPIERLLLTELDDETRENLVTVKRILDQKKPITKEQLEQFGKALQALEIARFTTGMNRDNMNALLSLLELYGMISHCQNPKNEPILGGVINKLRDIVLRVKGVYADSRTGSQGDAHEVFTALTNLIFEGSKWNQNMHKSLFVQSTVPGCVLAEGNPETGEIQCPQEKNWGRFELALKPGQPVQAHLEAHFEAINPTKDLANTPSYKAKGIPDPIPFTIQKEVIQLDCAPPLLVLSLNRFGIGVPKPFAPIQAEEFLTLDKKHFRDDQEGEYELYGAIRRHEDYAHYTADVKRGGAYFHCNDVGGKVDRSSRSDFMKEASTSYILVYRKL